MSAGALERRSRRVERSFDWQARDAQGQLQRGRSRAWGENQLRALLRRRGLRSLELRAVHAARIRAVRSDDVAQLTRQLAALLRAGLPLLQALQLLARSQTHSGVVDLLERLHADLENGMTLAAALRRQGAVFGPLYIALIEAGEASGRLDVLLERLAAHLDKSAALARRVRTALFYPAVVLAVALGVLAVIMVAVVPTFENVFASFGADLPWATQQLISLSRWSIQWGPAVLALALAGAVLWQRGWRPRWAARLDDALPLWGPLLRQAAVARWARTLATLLAAGLPLTEALHWVRGACGHQAYAQATLRVREQVARGNSLRLAMSRQSLFGPLLQQMAAIGEESGTLDELLQRAADFEEAQLDERIAYGSGLIEPATVVLLGLLIGAVVLALYLPIFQMGQIV
jgi:type IV pilus assembly protein PilC